MSGALDFAVSNAMGYQRACALTACVLQAESEERTVDLQRPRVQKGKMGRSLAAIRI
jgi:hypothetical protein